MKERSECLLRHFRFVRVIALICGHSDSDLPSLDPPLHRAIAVRAPMEKLGYLRSLLNNLSENTGLHLTAANDSIYTAESFVPKVLAVVPGTGKKESAKDAFLRKIHEALGMRGRDPIFRERGPGVLCIVIALETLLKMFPDDIEVDYTVDKILEATKRLYSDAGDPVSFNPLSHRFHHSR